MAFPLLSVPAIHFAFVACVLGEKHTVTFENNWGYGTPRLIKGRNILSYGESYTHQGPLSTVIAYLQNGDCGHDGVSCTLVEMTLGNPTCTGCGSSTDISLIPPESLADSSSGMTADCETAFFVSDDNQVQVHCQEDDVNLKITFCPGGITGYHNATLSSASYNTTSEDT